MKFEESVENSVTGSWGDLIFGPHILTGVLASILNVGINPDRDVLDNYALHSQKAVCGTWRRKND